MHRVGKVPRRLGMVKKVDLPFCFSSEFHQTCIADVETRCAGGDPELAAAVTCYQKAVTV